MRCTDWYRQHQSRNLVSLSVTRPKTDANTEENTDAGSWRVCPWAGKMVGAGLSQHRLLPHVRIIGKFNKMRCIMEENSWRKHLLRECGEGLVVVIVFRLLLTPRKYLRGRNYCLFKHYLISSVQLFQAAAEVQTVFRVPTSVLNLQEIIGATAAKTTVKEKQVHTAWILETWKCRCATGGTP